MAAERPNRPTVLPVSFSHPAPAQPWFRTPVRPRARTPAGAAFRPAPARLLPSIRRGRLSPAASPPGRVLDPGPPPPPPNPRKRNWSSARSPRSQGGPAGRPRGNVCFSPAQLDSILPLIALEVQVPE